MNQPTLFSASFAPSRIYPATPGWKGDATSREAAQSVAHKLPDLYAAILAELRKGDATPDEVAAVIGETAANVRSRFSELGKFQLIRKTNQTRINASGRKARVWRMATAQERAAMLAIHRKFEAMTSRQPVPAWVRAEMEAA